MRKRILAIFIAVTMVIAPTMAPASSVYGASPNILCQNNDIVEAVIPPTPPDEVPVNDWTDYFTVGFVEPDGSSWVEPTNDYFTGITRFYFVTGNPDYEPGAINNPTGDCTREVIRDGITYDATIIYTPIHPTWNAPRAQIASWEIENVAELPTAFFSRLTAAQNNIQNGVNIAAENNRANATFFFDAGRWIDIDYIDNHNLSGNNTSIVGLYRDADGESLTTIFKAPAPCGAGGTGLVGGVTNSALDHPGATTPRTLRWRFNSPNNYVENIIFDGSGLNMSPNNGVGSTSSRGSYFIHVGISGATADGFNSGSGAYNFVFKDVIIQNVGATNTSVNQGGTFAGVAGNQRNVAINILRITYGTRHFDNLTIRNVRTTGHFAVIQFNQTQNTYFRDLSLEGNHPLMHANAHPIKIENNVTQPEMNQWLDGNLNNQRDIIFDGTLGVPSRNSMFDGIYIQDYRYRNILLPEEFEWALLKAQNGEYNQPAMIVFDSKRSPAANINMGLAAVRRYSALQLSTGYWFVEAEPFTHHGSTNGGTIQAQLDHINAVINFLANPNGAVNIQHTETQMRQFAPNIKMIATTAGTLPGFQIPNFAEPSTIVALHRTDEPHVSIYPAMPHARGGVGDNLSTDHFVQFTGNPGTLILPTNLPGEHKIFNFDFKNHNNRNWTFIESAIQADDSQGHIHNFVRENSGRNLFFITLPTIAKAAGEMIDGVFVPFGDGDYVMVGDTIVYRLRVTNPGSSPIPAGMVVGDNINLYHVNWVGNVTINGTLATPGTAPNQYTFVFGGAPPSQQQFGIMPASLPGLLGQLRVTLPEIPADGYIDITFEVTARVPAAENPLYELDANGDYIIIDDEKVFLFYGVRNFAFIVNEGEDNTYSNIVDVEVVDPTAPTSPNIRKFSSVMLPTLATVGETIQYTLVVRNPGSETLENIQVRDTLHNLNWVRFIGFVDPTDPVYYNFDAATGLITVDIAELQARGRYEIRFEVEVLNAAALPSPAVRVIPNTVYLYVDDVQVDYDDQPVSIHPALPPEIRKSVNPTTAEPGDTVTYTLRIYNPNHAPNAGISLLNVEILDEFPEWIVPNAITTVTATTPSGGSLILPVEIDLIENEMLIVFELLPPGPGYTYIEFLATVAANAPTGSHDNNAHIYWNDVRVDSDTATVVVTGIQQPPQTTVTIAKTAAEPSVAVGETITYTITVTNTGTNPATNVVVTDTLPSQVTFVDSTSNVQGINFTHANGVLTSNVGTLAAGESIEFTVNVTADAAGNAVNNAVVAGGNFPAANDSEPVVIIDETQPQPEPGVSIAKTVVTGPTVAPGGTVVYTLVVTNTGDVELTSLEVSDILPPELTPVNTSLVLPAGATGGFSGNTLTVNLAALAPSASVTIVFAATVDLAAEDGDEITNAATVIDLGTGVSDDDHVTVTVEEPYEPKEFDVNIVKVATSGNTVVVGGTVTYSLVVTNTGSAYLHDLVVTDTLPEQLTPDTSTLVLPVSAAGGFSGNTLTVDLAPLAPGASVIITFAADVATDLAHNSTIPNTATVSNDEVNAGNSETVRVLAPDVAIEKSVSPTSVTAGSNVTYTLRITNSGGVPLTSLVVTDNLPSQLNPVTTSLTLPTGATGGFDGNLLEVELANLAPGASVTITFTATVASGTAVGTTITNTATVTDIDTEVTASDSATVTIGGGGGGGGGGGTPQPPVEVPDPEPPLVEMSPYHHAYIIGYPDGYVRPARNITRAEVATIFFRLISDEHRVNIWSQSNPFADVILQNWFNNAISTLTNANLLYGYPDGYFRPNQDMTRAEFSAVIVRIMGQRDAMVTATSSFTDVSGHWGEAYINVAYQLGWVRGYGDGTFRPNQLITRAEVAALVNRALNRLPETPADLLADMVIWPDNMNTGAWYYLYMQEATNSHYHEMKADGIHETWTELIEPREWWRLERPNSNPGIFTGAYIGEGLFE